MYRVELCQDGGEESAGRAPVGGEVEGDDLLVGQHLVRTHHLLVRAEQLLPRQAVHAVPPQGRRTDRVNM